MFHGESVRVLFKTTELMMDNIVDWFGKDIRVTKQKTDEITVSVNCNYDAMFYWALQYGPYVEVLEPQSLRTDIRKAVENMAEKYR